jgi:hypothetical protein
LSWLGGNSHPARTTSINFGIINSITRLHLVGYFYWFILRCKGPWILNSLQLKRLALNQPTQLRM